MGSVKMPDGAELCSAAAGTPAGLGSHQQKPGDVAFSHATLRADDRPAHDGDMARGGVKL